MDVAGAIPALILTVVLLVLNAFFVAAEFAIVRVRSTQLDQLAAEGSASARMAAHIAAHIDAYLSACQVGITAASLGLGWVGEPGVARLIEPLFGWLIAWNEALFHVVSFAIAFGLITYLHIVVGEQAPKYFAIQRAVPTSLWLAYPLHVFYRVAYPFIVLVNASANRILQAIGIPVRPGDSADTYSDEELKMLVAASARKGILEESERVIVGNALDFADTLVRQVMVPRTEIVAVPEDLDLAGLVAAARQTRLSRFPVYRDDLDHIVGVVHVKDLVGVDRTSHAKAHDIMRRVPTIPETVRLDQALTEFRRQRAQLAIVVDGLVPLSDLRERLKVELADEPYDTVGGMVFGRLGRLAEVGDAIEVEGYRFQVSGVDGRRVAQVRVQRARPPKRAA